MTTRQQPTHPTDEEILTAMTQAIIFEGDKGVNIGHSPDTPYRLAKRILAAIRAYERMKEAK